MNRLIVLFALALPLVLGDCYFNRTQGFSAERSQKFYVKNCASCHGADAAQFVQRDWKNGNSRLELLRSMKTGEHHAFAQKLDEKKVLYLSDYLLQLMSDQKGIALEKAAPKDGIFVSEGMKLRLDTLVRDLENPWGIAFLPNNDMLFTERTGNLWRMDATGQKTAVKGVPKPLVESQGGLLDVEIHPNFEQNRWVYLSYSKYKDSLGTNYSTTAIFRARLEKDSLVDGRDIFVALPYTKTRYHYGNRMEFDRAGLMYLSVGDRGMQDSFPQHLDKFPGKIHRIKDDGSIPSDNPFVGKAGHVGSIWSYGHRNPQGLAMHPVTGEIWETEHGPKGGDEVNIIQKGKNFGWPVASFGTHYDGRSFTEMTQRNDIAAPLDYWVPSIGPCGLAFVTSDRYLAWKGDLLCGSLRFKYLDRCDLNGSTLVKHEQLLPNIGRMRCIATDRNGYLYVAVEEPGMIFRLVPVP